MDVSLCPSELTAFLYIGGCICSNPQHCTPLCKEMNLALFPYSFLVFLFFVFLNGSKSLSLMLGQMIIRKMKLDT